MDAQQTQDLFVFMLDNLEAEDTRRDNAGLPDSDPWVQQNIREVSSLRRIVMRMAEHGGDPMILQLLSWRYIDKAGYQKAWFAGTTD